MDIFPRPIHVHEAKLTTYLRQTIGRPNNISIIIFELNAKILEKCNKGENLCYYQLSTQTQEYALYMYGILIHHYDDYKISFLNGAELKTYRIVNKCMTCNYVLCIEWLW